MKYSKYIPFISAIGDLLILNFLFNFLFCYLRGFDQYCFSTISISFFLFINLTWIISALIFKAYRLDYTLYKKEILFIYIKTIIIFFFLFLLFFQVTSYGYYSRDNIKLLFPAFFTLVVSWRFFLYYIFFFYRKYGFNYRNVIIIGYNDRATDLKDYFNNNLWAGYRFNGFFTYQKSDKKNIVGTYGDLESFVMDNNIDEIYIMTNEIHKSIYSIISSVTSKNAVKIRLVPDLSYFSYMSLKLVDYDMVSVMKIQQGPLNFWLNRLIKRFFDIVVSIVVIVLILSWLIPLLSIIDLFSQKEGVFFVQPRSGLNNKTFGLLKFRTMKKNSDAHTKQAAQDDNRITKLGEILRKTSIDELPQFFNVILGKMSVIGPRPHMLKHTEEYKTLVNKFMIRHAVKPGITGYAQVRGHRGEIKKTKDMKERVKLDIFYIENWTLSLDFKIVFLTIGNLLKGDKKAY